MDRIEAEQITIGKRYRKELGDLTDLKRSIQDTGLINPITIRRGSNLLLAGERRLKCLKDLGVTELVEGEHFRYFDDLDNPVAVEFDENVIRKDFLPSEKVEIALAMETVVKPEAMKRRLAGVAAEQNVEDNYSDDESGSDEETGEGEYNQEEPEQDSRKKNTKSNDKIAAAVGWGRKTLEKAKEIVVAAQENPEKFGGLVQEMDSTGSVDGAHQKLSLIKTVDEKKKYDLCDEVLTMNSSDTLEVPKFFLKALVYIPKAKQRWLVNEYKEYIFRLKQTDFERTIKSYSKSSGVLSLTEDQIITALTDVLELTRNLYEEWPFITHARNINYQLLQALTSKNSRVTTLDKLELIMIAMGSLLTQGHPVFKRAVSEKLFEKLPVEKQEAYLTMLSCLRRLYGPEGKASLPVALVKKEDFEKLGWKEAGDVVPGIDEERSLANAFVMHDVIEDRMGEFQAVEEILDKILQDKARQYKADVKSGRVDADIRDCAAFEESMIAAGNGEEPEQLEASGS